MKKIEFIDFCGYLNKEMSLNRAIYYWHDFKNNHELLLSLIIEEFQNSDADLDLLKSIQRSLQCSIMQAEIYIKIFFTF